MVMVSNAEIRVYNSPVCVDLAAGKKIDAGNLCVEILDDILYVTYVTTGEWELVETHLFVGPDLESIPRNRKGNPKVGHYPYHSGDITGSVNYSHVIPLSELGGVDYYDTLCGETYLVSAHSKVRRPDGYGGYKTQTAWAVGTRLVEKGNWAMYFNIQFICENLPPVTQCMDVFAYGDVQLGDILGPSTWDWGWENVIYPGTRQFQPVFVGGNNTPSNGTFAGYLYIGYSGTYLRVEYIMVPPYAMTKTNLYVGTGQPQNADPETYGYHHTLINDFTDVYVVPIVGDPIYVVAHAWVCLPMIR